MGRSIKRRWTALVLVAALVAVGGVYVAGADQGGRDDPRGGTRHRVEDRGMTAPATEAAMSAESAQLTQEEHEQLVLRKKQMREEMAARQPKAKAGAEAAAEDNTPETAVSQGETQFHGNPGDLVVARNLKNTNANNAALASTLAEPAAANNARRVFAAGNFRHVEWWDGGAWMNVPLPGGPANAPTLCCDHDIVIDNARRVVFHSALYVNASLSEGVVSIFVRRNIPNADCRYDIDLAGTALPDYPHLGLTKRHVYLSVNAVGVNGGFARMYKFNADQMADCVGAATSTFTQSFATFGRRVWTPGEGANNLEVMYWGQLDNATTYRIFRWREDNNAVQSFTRAISFTPSNNPDCRGGVGNFDYIGALNASLIGFQLRTTAAPGANFDGSGVVASYWQAGTDAAHPQGHIHAAVFRMQDLALIAQPHVWNAGTCFGFPSVTANKRGDIGISLAFGGKAGGGGSAAQGAIGIDDEFTPGIGFFGGITLVAAGTHNRSDGRFGDYFTIHAHEPCEKWFSATSYARNGGTGIANINSRYVEFGRRQSLRCWRAHSNHVAVP